MLDKLVVERFREGHGNEELKKQRPKGTHSWGRTRTTVLCTGVWFTCWQITEDWKIPILIYSSDPCTTKSTDCTCNPVIIPGHTHMACVEEIQAIQHIGTRETERGAGDCALPPHLIDVLDAATDLMIDQRARAADLLAKHINTFPAPGTPITGRTEAVMHEIDTGSTRPIRCNPRKLSPKKIKIQQELVDKMSEDGQIEHSVSAWSAPTVLVTKKDGTTRFCVDYRRLNARTKKDAFPVPRIDDSLNSLSGQAWFSRNRKLHLPRTQAYFNSLWCLLGYVTHQQHLSASWAKWCAGYIGSAASSISFRRPLRIKTYQNFDLWKANYTTWWDVWYV